ncbi:MAG: hypothetical protein ACI909_003157, partial [Planctomycetota bacterium]
MGKEPGVRIEQDKRKVNQERKFELSTLVGEHD